MQLLNFTIAYFSSELGADITCASNKPIPGSTVGKHNDEDELTNNNVFDHELRLNPQNKTIMQCWMSSLNLTMN